MEKYETINYKKKKHGRVRLHCILGGPDAAPRRTGSYREFQTRNRKLGANP